MFYFYKLFFSQLRNRRTGKFHRRMINKSHNRFTVIHELSSQDESRDYQSEIWVNDSTWMWPWSRMTPGTEWVVEDQLTRQSVLYSQRMCYRWSLRVHDFKLTSQTWHLWNGWCPDVVWNHLQVYFTLEVESTVSGFCAFRPLLLLNAYRTHKSATSDISTTVSWNIHFARNYA